MEYCKNKYFVYDSCFSPQQQPDDEKNAPPALVKKSGLYSNGKSIPRECRKERGYGRLVFLKDLSKCYLYIYIKNIKSCNIEKIHIHVGAPQVLGPVIVNVGELINITKDLASGYVKITLKDKDIKKFTLGETEPCNCPGMCEQMNSILPKPYLVNGTALETGTIASLNGLARLGLLYFNFHNAAENFYGIMRGQIYPIEDTIELN